MTRALGHIRSDSPDIIQYDFYKVLRSCPQCPTEYLIEVRKMDEVNDHVFQQKDARYVRVLSKWKDFGDVKSPLSAEWLASTICPYRGWRAAAESHCGEGMGKIRTRYERSIGNEVEDLEVFPSVEVPFPGGGFPSYSAFT